MSEKRWLSVAIHPHARSAKSHSLLAGAGRGDPLDPQCRRPGGRHSPCLFSASPPCQTYRSPHVFRLSTAPLSLLLSARLDHYPGSPYWTEADPPRTLCLAALAYLKYLPL